MTCLASSDFASSTFFPTRGYRGATPSVPYTGDDVSVLYWRHHERLILATPCPGDASFWRRLILAMLGAVNLLTLALTLTLTLVNARGRDICLREKTKVSPTPSTWHFPYC